MSVRRWLGSTSNRTFIAIPIAIAAIEAVLAGGVPAVNPWALPLCAWGYLQYRLVGNFRLREGRGGPGLSVPPERLVTDGPYRYVRNPMYVGHLLFLVGLALVFRSWIGAAVLVVHIVWFHRRVLRDEERLKQMFGDDYAAYASRVKRWVPGVI